MRFQPALKPAVLRRRYKRFLADVELPDGHMLTIHCPNTGSMKNCQTPGSRIWYSTSTNHKRKYPHSWRVVEVDEGCLVGIDTSSANRLAVEAIETGIIAQLQGYPRLEQEVSYGELGSRIDILLSDPAAVGDGRCFIEVKNVSLGVGAGLGLFPDAVTRRGQKHLRELIRVKHAGARAVLLFCVQHNGVQRVSPADAIDPEYGRLLREAAGQGVELLAYGADIDIENSEIRLQRELAVQL